MTGGDRMEVATSTVQVWAAPIEGLSRLLSRHPHIEWMGEATSGIRYQQGAWERRIEADRPDLPVKGLIELMDNNPIVCADEMSVPGPASTLALIALGPLLRAGAPLEPPSIAFSFEDSGEDVAAWLATESWTGEAHCVYEPVDAGTVLACTGMAVVRTPDSPEEFRSLYEESFGRSFFVWERPGPTLPWDEVEGSPYAFYSVEVSASDEPTCLVAVRVIADRNGKCGAAQLVHALNLMAGFEESMGIAE